jgi:DNA-binding NarL/FixJ family response regulator
MSGSRLITVLVVEDNEITRVGLELTLNQIAGLKVVGSVTDGLAAVEQAKLLNPNIVVMDIGLPEIDGIEATRRIKAERPAMRVVMLSSHDTDDVLFSALSAGADAYCLKEISSAQLEMALKSVADGAAWLDPAVSSRVLAAFTGNAPSPLTEIAKVVRSESPLSLREADVLRLVIEGFSNQEIADRLGLSVETIKTHMRHIMEKLAVTDRTQAAVKAMRQGFI